MKRPLKLFLRFVAAIALISIVMIGLEMRRLWMGYHDTVIIATGPFASRFAYLYPNNPEMEKEIEQWFLEVIPIGTTRE